MYVHTKHNRKPVIDSSDIYPLQCHARTHGIKKTTLSIFTSGALLASRMRKLYSIPLHGWHPEIAGAIRVKGCNKTFSARSLSLSLSQAIVPKGVMDDGVGHGPCAMGHAQLRHP